MSQRRLEYVGGALRSLQRLPEEVQDIVAFALLEAMNGHKHPDAAPLRGFRGGGVLAIHCDYLSDAYRVVYTIDVPGVVYVLHAFKKKSTKGSETPIPDKDLIQVRYKRLQTLQGRKESI